MDKDELRAFFEEFDASLQYYFTGQHEMNIANWLEEINENLRRIAAILAIHWDIDAKEIADFLKGQW